MRVAVVHSGGAYQQRVCEYLGTAPEAELIEFEISAPGLPMMMDEEDVAGMVPIRAGDARIVIAINLPAAVLAEIPHAVGGRATEGLIVPVEDPTWVRPGVVRQVTRDCAKHEMESAFPKPFCALKPHTPVITEFCDTYRAGEHRIDITCQNGRVTEAKCPRSSPCGLTAWAVEQLEGESCDETLPDRLVELLHVRPCLASQAMDDELGDTIMHKAIGLMEQTARDELQRLEVAAG